MKIQVFSPSHDFMDTTAEITPSEVIELSSITVNDDATDIDERRDSLEHDIISSFYHIQNCPNNHAEMFHEMIQSCFVFWSTDPTIQDTIEENSNTKDGFVNIMFTGLEVGWRDRRYH